MKFLFSIKSILICLLCVFVVVNLVFFTMMYTQNAKNSKKEKKSKEEINKERLELLKNNVDFNHTYYSKGNKYVVYYGANKKIKPY